MCSVHGTEISGEMQAVSRRGLKTGSQSELGWHRTKPCPDAWCSPGRRAASHRASLGGEPELSLLHDGRLSWPPHLSAGSRVLDPVCALESPGLPSQGLSFQRSQVDPGGGTLYYFQVPQVIWMYIQDETPWRRELSQALSSYFGGGRDCHFANLLRHLLPEIKYYVQGETPSILWKQACVQNTVCFQLQYCFPLPPAGSRACNSTP